MSNIKLKMAFVALCVFANTQLANAETVNGTIGFSGSSNGVCSLDNNAINVGSINLSDFENPHGTATLLPVSLGVTCNSPTIQWKIYGTVNADAGVPVTIGTVTDNQACLMSAEPAAIAAGIVCAQASSTGAEVVGGIGSQSASALIAIWWPHDYGQGNGMQIFPFSGTGDISGTLPIVLEF